MQIAECLKTQIVKNSKVQNAGFTKNQKISEKLASLYY